MSTEQTWRGFRVIETPAMVKNGSVQIYPFRWLARKAAAQGNGYRAAPSYRLEVEKAPRGIVAWWPLPAWSVVPRQNKLVEIKDAEDEGPWCHECSHYHEGSCLCPDCGRLVGEPRRGCTSGAHA